MTFLFGMQTRRHIAASPIQRRNLASGCFLMAALLIVPDMAIGAIPTRSYSSAEDNSSSSKNRASQIFQSHDDTVIETRIYSSYSLLVWKGIESIDEGDVRSFSVEGDGGVLFSVHESGAYWGYYSDPQRLNIFSLNDSEISVSVRETLKEDYEYRALLVQNGRIKAYDCKLDLTPFSGETSMTINGSSYKLSTTDLNRKIMVEVSKYLSKNGVDIVRDHCVKNTNYIRESAMRFNEDEVVQPDGS